MDRGLREALRHQFDCENNRPAVNRINEFADPEVDRSWLWQLNKHHGPSLTSDEFVEAVRVRLGCAGPTDPVPCARCGACLLDSAGSHAACCSRAESTRGHYSVAGQFLGAIQQCDPLCRGRGRRSHSRHTAEARRCSDNSNKQRRNCFGRRYPRTHGTRVRTASKPCTSANWGIMGLTLPPWSGRTLSTSQ